MAPTSASPAVAPHRAAPHRTAPHPAGSALRPPEPEPELVLVLVLVLVLMPAPGLVSGRPAPGQALRPPPEQAQDQRFERLSRTAAATVPAVEVLSTVGPSRQAAAPAARKAALSESVIPPSGPTTTSRSPDSGRLRRTRPLAAPGSRTIAQAAFAIS